MQFSQPRLLIFSDPLFLLFFLIVFAIHWLLRGYGVRKSWLLICSYIFYASWDYRFLSLILISTAVDYVAGLAIWKSESTAGRRRWLILSLATNLGILGFFKYFHFFVDSAAVMLGWLGLPALPSTLEIILPVGISFYTFQTMSYTIDIFLGKLKPRRNLLDFALFVAFFPQLIAGPIVRAREFLPQVDKPRRFNTIRWRVFLTLFVIGYVKKSCISDRIAGFIDPFFATDPVLSADPASFASSFIWAIMLLYAVQIYCDFSAYSDMAIACAGMLGFQLPQNFNFPYLAGNITEFWHRWHISLSTWLRDYLYIPLGGSRGPTWFVWRNLMLTMLLGGLWHGASWKFIVWGGLHGAALVVHRIWKSSVGEKKPMRFVGPVLTLSWVCLLWIFFRAPDWQTAMVFCNKFLFLNPSGTFIAPPWVWGSLVALAAVHWIASRWSPLDYVYRLPEWLFAILLGVVYALAISLAAVNTEPFIYFQF